MPLTLALRLRLHLKQKLPGLVKNKNQFLLGLCKLKQASDKKTHGP